MKVKLLSHVQLLATSWTTAYQAPPSMGFSRQEYWSGLPLPSPESLSSTSHFLQFEIFNMSRSHLVYPECYKHIQVGIAGTYDVKGQSRPGLIPQVSQPCIVDSILRSLIILWRGRIPTWIMVFMSIYS